MAGMVGKSYWSEPIGRMLRRIAATASQIDVGFPHYADPETGTWATSPQGDWTGGFWGGLCWLAYRQTRDARYLEWAHRCCERLRPRISSETVFRGFLFFYGAAVGDILLSDALGREVGILGARGLATLFNPRAGAIPLGNEAEEASSVGAGEANVDGVSATALLAWAAQRTGDTSLREVAVRHAERHVEFCLRSDGSVCQSARFDPATGALLERYTHKGIRDDSTWTRAQAWAMLGYAQSAAWFPEQPLFLETAMRTADWWMAHIPDDLVAYWDFDAPVGPGTERDTSGTAVAAAALLKLSRTAPDERQRRLYGQFAADTVKMLVEGFLTPTHPGDSRPAGMLIEGCYNRRIGLATSNELIWGDYYLFESLQALAGLLDPVTI